MFLDIPVTEGILLGVIELHQGLWSTLYFWLISFLIGLYSDAGNTVYMEVASAFCLGGWFQRT